MPPEQLTKIFTQVYLGIMGGGFVLLLLLETLFPLDPRVTESERTRRVLRNFGLWTVGLVVADAIVGDWLLDIPARLFTPTRGLLHAIALPLPILIVVGVLVVDFGEYVFHRLSHSVRWLWLIHAVHHADDRLDVATALRFHPGETTINVVWKAVFLWLLGLPLWLIAARGPLMVSASFLQHANLRVPEWLDRRLRWVLITPLLHRMHHSPLAAENNTSFGEIFSFWDRLFGTLHAPPQPSVGYGLPNLHGDRWHSFVGMMLTPLRARHLRTL
ncbi:MAG: sterol desaturase family protein [Deltaproteobacteria bacterium]|nr:sterol desaturase family protein [Deltaproteobacteria bacterium]